jgi:hypothetical protein
MQASLNLCVRSRTRIPGASIRSVNSQLPTVAPKQQANVSLDHEIGDLTEPTSNITEMLWSGVGPGVVHPDRQS